MTRQLSIALIAMLLEESAARAASDNPFRNLNCNVAKTQIEMDYCAGRDFKVADAKLNTLYRSLLDSYDQKNQTLLKTAEHNWISYRDAECDLETAASEGGSIYPMEYSLCLTQKTKARVKELENQRDCGPEFGCSAPEK